MKINYWKGIVLLFTGAIILFGCAEKYPQWVIDKTIDLDKSGPIGIALDGDQIWISDGNNNLLKRYDSEFSLIESIDGFERPMHIDVQDGKVYIPEYGSDEIIILTNGMKDTLISENEFNAPAGIDVSGNAVAIADFYSNSVFIKNGGKWSVIGEKGDGPGQFHYPTDVQIFKDTLYVADAYNHRIQIMSMDGNHIRTIGVAQEMNATTGIYVTNNEIFATDLENDRVIVFDHLGNVLNVIDEGFDKPTDLIISDDKLYVLNYGSGEVVILRQAK